MKTTDKEQKEIIKFAKKFFGKKKEPTTVALISINQDEGASAFGCGDTDEIVTGVTMFAKELDEASRYSLCCQVLSTLPSAGIMCVFDEVLKSSGKIKIKKGKLQ